MIVREAQPTDYPAVDALLEQAFGGRAEAELVRQLRGDGDAEIELVVELAGQVAGHVLFSALQAPMRALALAPLAVAPRQQRQGIGTKLVRAGHELARMAGWHTIFVVGDPGYYARFGYDPALAAPFDSPYAGPHFMALRLDPEVRLDGGTVRYAPAFQALEE